MHLPICTAFKGVLLLSFPKECTKPGMRKIVTNWGKQGERGQHHVDASQYQINGKEARIEQNMCVEAALVSVLCYLMLW